MKWTRPENIPFPSVWSYFKSKNVVNGLTRTYWIQDLTDEYKDEVLHHMSTDFVKQETLRKYSGMADDLQSLEEFVTILKDILDQRISLICLTKDNHGVTHLVGCNILSVLQKGDKIPAPKGKSLSMVFSAYDVYYMKDLYSELNVPSYLNSIGLYVLPQFRDEQIDSEILKARRELSLAMGFKVSVALFTSITGQRSAAMAEFKDIIVFPYKDLKKLNTSYEFSGIENDCTKSMRLMYARYSK